jgi:hypothetical protein
MALIFPVQAGIVAVAVIGTGLAFSQLPLMFWVGHALFALACFAWGWLREHDFVFMPAMGYGCLLVGAACFASLYLICHDFGVAEELVCAGRRVGGLFGFGGPLGFWRLVPHLAPFCLTMGCAILTGYLFRPRI